MYPVVLYSPLALIVFVIERFEHLAQAWCGPGARSGHWGLWWGNRNRRTLDRSSGPRP